MKDALVKDGLNPALRRLVDLLRNIEFGSVEHLIVRSGEPVFNPPPRILRTIKLRIPTEVTRPRPSGEIKDQVLHLIKELRRLDNGIIHRIEIQHGLLFLITLEGDLHV